MSRIGKRIITIPAKVEITWDGSVMTVKGPLDTLKREFKPAIKIAVENNEITLAPTAEDKATRSLWGTYGSHIANMVEGVTKGYEKKLTIEGVGYKMNVVGPNVVLNIGYSHDVSVEIPAGIKVTAEKNVLTIVGADKEAVGSFAAKLRSYKKPEPYKGKGIRYTNEVVRRKQGKKSTA